MLSTVWFKGLVSAFVTGSASALSAYLVDPSHFNLNSGFKALLTVGVTGGVVGALAYLKQSPLNNR